MNLSSSDTINAPVDQVYRLIRDEMPKVAEFIPDISRIKKISEDKIPGTNKTKIINHWFSSIELPSLLKAFITEDLLSWKDVATWDDEAKRVDFFLEPFIASTLFTASGNNVFTAKGENSTLMTVTFDVELYPENIPGLPRFIAAKAKPAVESLLKKILYPNMTNLAKGLNEYIKSQK